MLRYTLVGGLELIVLGCIRWCVWLVQSSSPLAVATLHCLFVCCSGAA